MPEVCLTLPLPSLTASSPLTFSWSPAPQAHPFQGADAHPGSFSLPQPAHPWFLGLTQPQPHCHHRLPRGSHPETTVLAWVLAANFYEHEDLACSDLRHIPSS